MEDELAVVRQVIQGSGVRVIVLTAGLVRYQSQLRDGSHTHLMDALTHDAALASCALYQNDAAQVLLWAYTNGFVGTDFVWIAPDSVMIG